MDASFLPVPLYQHTGKKTTPCHHYWVTEVSFHSSRFPSSTVLKDIYSFSCSVFTWLHNSNILQHHLWFIQPFIICIPVEWLCCHHYPSQYTQEEDVPPLCFPPQCVFTLHREVGHIFNEGCCMLFSSHSTSCSSSLFLICAHRPGPWPVCREEGLHEVNIIAWLPSHTSLALFFNPQDHIVCASWPFLFPY